MALPLVRTSTPRSRCSIRSSTSTRDRRNKKREIRALWIQRINAAARLNGISYSQFMHGLKVAGIELDRKVLSQMAYEDIESFNELAAIAKKALEA